MMSNDPAHFDLWTNTYSLCSSMIRYTIAVRGDPEPGSVPITVEEHELDIVEKMEQLDEHFLLGVNAKGQVPVLVNPTVFPKPLTESLEMARFLIQLYPSLSGPKTRLREADTLLAKLHDLDYYTLSFAHNPVIATVTVAACERRLAEATRILYKEALANKLKLYKDHKGNTISPAKIAAVDRETRNYLHTVLTVMRRSDGPWIYGSHGPTALDTHFVTFLHRLKDAGHFHFFDETLDRYLDMATRTAEWNQVMQGRRTLPQEVLVIREEQ